MLVFIAVSITLILWSIFFAIFRYVFNDPSSEALLRSGVYISMIAMGFIYSFIG